MTDYIGVNVKRVNVPGGSGILLDAKEILSSLAQHLTSSDRAMLEELAGRIDLDLAISDATLVGLDEEGAAAHDPHAQGYGPPPTSKEEWEAHCAFYRLTVSQRDRAWVEIRDREAQIEKLESGVKPDGSNIPGAPPDPRIEQ